MNPRHPLKGLAVAIVVAAVLPACGGGDALVVYSGRSESLIAPLIESFTESTGIEVEVRYGSTSEMAATILEEEAGGDSPADLFFAQDAGALGEVAAAGIFDPLSTDRLERVPEPYRHPDGLWMGTSGRARVVAYNTEAVSEADLPTSILDYTDPSWKGRIGWAPSNASFQAFVTALRVSEGEDGARAWLEGIVANEPVAFDNNIATVEAVASGEVDVGFVNHYYLFELAAENPDYGAANHYFDNGDIGGLVNVAGVGILGSTERRDDADAFVDYLTSAAGQTFFAEKTFEIPLIEGVDPVPGVPAIDDLAAPPIALTSIGDLDGTLALLSDLGIV